DAGVPLPPRPGRAGGADLGGEAGPEAVALAADRRRRGAPRLRPGGLGDLVVPVPVHREELLDQRGPEESLVVRGEPLVRVPRLAGADVGRAGGSAAGAGR